jgi:hypothetical protein
MESRKAQRRTTANFKMATAGLFAVLIFGWISTPVCFGGSEAAESAETAEVPAIHTPSKAVLVIPGKDCQTASFVLATVTRHIRDAERSALYSSAAEDEYDDGIQALIERDCLEGIEHLRACDRALQQTIRAPNFS